MEPFLTPVIPPGYTLPLVTLFLAAVCRIGGTLFLSGPQRTSIAILVLGALNYIRRSVYIVQLPYSLYI